MHSLGGGGGSHHSRSMRSIAENVAMALGSTASRDPMSSDSDDIEDIEDVDDIRDDYLDHSDSDADTVVQHPVRVRTNGSSAALTTWRDKLDAHVPVLVSVTIGAYLGVGMRVLLTEFAQALAFHQTELLHLLGLSYFLPNALGCFIMGVAVRGKPLFRNQFGVYFTGITTGFCGCCTTFASWDLGAAVLFVHGEWVNALLVLSVQVASAITSFRVGVHCGDGVIQYFTTRMYPFRKPPVDLNQLKLDLERYILGLRAVKANAFGQLVSRRVRATEQALVISKDACSELMSEIAQVEQDYYRVVHRGHAWLLTGGVATGFVWLITALCSDNYARSRLLALCFGPFGALLRYYLSLRNAEPRCKNFPLYTFVPNVLASILTCGIEVIGSAVAAAHDDSSGGYASTTAFKAFVLFGQGAAQVGVLGSLSTVSTWVNELDVLSSRRVFWAYRYAIASVVVSQFASACILGVYVAQGNGPLLS